VRTLHVAALVLAVAGCHEGAPPAPLPTTLPAFFDVSRRPDRPRLIVSGPAATSLDTNDARFYYAAGMAVRDTNPEGASAAFYWASRLDPSWAEPYYARWYVLHGVTAVPLRVVRAGRQMVAFLSDSGRALVDSLALMAYRRDPYFDDGLAMGDLVAEMRIEVTAANLGQIDLRYMNDMLAQRDEPPLAISIGHSRRAAMPHDWYVAYGDRDFARASARLAATIRKNPEAYGLYVYRAKAQFFLRQYDSAAATMRSAVARLETTPPAAPLPIYFSREEFTYAVGMAEQVNGHDSAARAAYQQTVTENPRSYMGHLHLANAALAAGDTALAIAQASVAADIQPDDPVVQLVLGYTLLNAGQTDDAATHLDAAVHADSDYALPYLYLGQARVAQRDTAGAVAALRGFLARARRGDTHRRTVRATLAALVATPPPAP
jgi:tetratricopeptide (TPR) repeat protein